jgi:chromosome segregation ATPase
MSSRVNGSEQAETVKARTLADVEGDVAGAVEELQRLKAESESLLESRKAATAEQDAVRVEEIDGRAQFLEVEIDAVQARLWQLYAEQARRQLPEAEAKAAEAKAEYDRAHADYVTAHARVNRLGVESDNARVRALSLRQAVEENERRAREVVRRLPAGVLRRL